MLIFDHVSAGYTNKKPVLKDVSFSLPAGALTALLGRNGSGKSTLFACVNREVRYDGTILLDGIRHRSLRARELARKAALLPQSLNKVHLTVRELASFGRNPHRTFGVRIGQEDREAVERAMQAVGVLPLAERYTDQLSGGERQKAYLAMVLAQETPLILLDEPTTYMDAAGQIEFMQLLADICRTGGKTLFMATHDLAFAAKYADHLLILDDGRVRFDGTVDECLTNHVMESVFGVRQHVLYDKAERYILFDAPKQGEM